MVERELAKEGTDPGPRQGEIHRARLGVEEAVRRHDHRTAQKARRFLRLVAGAVHHGWGLTRAVREVFVRLYNEGLIYRGDYIINWCPRCKTALSDLEVEHEETKGHLYHIKYPLAYGGGYLTVATTRPETMLGDTAVAVNPEDARYGKYVGQNVILPIVNKEDPCHRGRLCGCRLRHRGAQGYAGP